MGKINNAVTISNTAQETSIKSKKLANQAKSQAEQALLGSVPVGTILPWIPTDNMPAPPKGWKICDGTNGTPDLEARFLVGVRPLKKTQKKGGRADIPNQGNHAHGGATTFGLNTAVVVIITVYGLTIAMGLKQKACITMVERTVHHFSQ